MSWKTAVSSTDIMSGSLEPVCIKQEPETLVTEHSQSSDTDRLTLTEPDTTEAATGSLPDWKTQFAAEVGLDTEIDTKPERSWTEVQYVQANHDALSTTVVTSGVGQGSCTVTCDTESKESADMSQYTTWHSVHNVGTEQFMRIKQEVDDTDVHQTAELDAQTAVMNQEKTSSSACPASISPADIQANSTQDDTRDSVSVKTEPQEYTEYSISDTDTGDKPTHVFPVGLYQNFHASHHISKTSVSRQSRGETTSTVSAAGRLDTGECESLQQNTGTSEKRSLSGVKCRSGQLPAVFITATEEGPFICEQCWATFSSSIALKDHVKSHIDNKPYVCEQCQAGFNRLDHLKRHMFLHAGGTPFVCDDCGAAFNELTVLKRHKMGHSREKPIVCEQCGKSFASSRHLNSHMKTHTGEKPYVCEHCQEAFIHPSNLKQHMMIHIGDKPYVCKECGAAFNQTSHLKQHMMVHAGDSPFVCDDCGAAFNTLAILKYHMAGHTRDKSVACEQCGKRFANSKLLNSHMKTHTGDKPFVCEQCGAAFRWSNCLKSHMLSHTGDKPYKCQQCGAAFRWSSCLKRHMSSHTGDKSYKCKQCGATFNRSCSLKRHTRIHTGEKPFVCNQCGTAFNQSSTLKQHMKTHSESKKGDDVKSTGWT